MHFNVYIDDKTGQQLNHFAEQIGETRNALIRQAINEWLARQGKPEWPEIVMSFKGMANIPLFEASRDKLTPPSEDPFA